MSDIKGFKDTINWYNENAKAYANVLAQFPNLKLLEDFADLLPSGASILDAGSAGGRDSGFFRGRGYKVTGIDLSEGLLNEARMTHPCITFVQGDFRELPFEGETFDAVWSHASLLHFETIEDVEKSFTEFHRVLRPGGVLSVFVKQPPGKEKFSIVSDKLSGHDRFFQWFTAPEVKRLLEEAGFTVEKISENFQDPAGRKDVHWVAALGRR